MKNVVFAISLFGLMACSAQEMSVTIPANQRIEIDFPNYALWIAALHNKSSQQIEIVVLNKSTQDTIRGFGLNFKAKAEVQVERGNKLVLSNNTSKSIKVGLRATEMNPVVQPSAKPYRSFTMRNTSAKSIPLEIPGVMNPNLSPFSKSGVSLALGQEVFFKVKNKRYLLFIVDETISDGAEIDVADLIQKRKQELGV